MSSNVQSGGVVHVRGHSRGSRQGTVDVSAYDRSPPGGGGASHASDRVWERHGNAELRHAIAQAERSAEHRHHGYRQYNDAGGGRGAFGRYQLRMSVLVETGWMDKLGRWTEKAASHGVKNDVDFLDRPEVQERAMTDALRVYDRQARALNLHSHVGQKVSDTNGSALRVTWAGIMAAGHRVGMTGVSEALQRMTANKAPTTKKDKERDAFVRKRLREFDNVSYDSERN